MKEYEITVYKLNTGEIIDEFIEEFISLGELHDFMENEIHNYNEPYFTLFYDFTSL